MSSLLNLLSFVFVIWGFARGIRAVVNRTFLPRKSSWFIWLAINAVTFVLMWRAGTLNGQITASLIGTVAMAGLMIWFGEKGFTMTDRWCMAGAGVAIPLMLVSTKLALVMSMSANTLGAVPTIISAWKDPRREDRKFWTLALMASICATMRIENWTVEEALQPMVFLVLQIVIIAPLYLPHPYYPPDPLDLKAAQPQVR